MDLRAAPRGHQTRGVGGTETVQPGLRGRGRDDAAPPRAVCFVWGQKFESSKILKSSKQTSGTCLADLLCFLRLYHQSLHLHALAG